MATQRWQAWMAMLHRSDAALIQLATMAVAAVLIWESTSQVPERWRELSRSAYLFGLLILFAYFMGGSMFAWAMFVVMFAVGGALAVWWQRRQARERQLRDAENAKVLARLEAEEEQPGGLMFHINWPRAIVKAGLAITGVVIGFITVTGLLAVQLVGGFVDTWARVLWLFCNTTAQCGSPSTRLGFMVAFGVMLSVASIPIIVGLYPRPPKEE